MTEESKLKAEEGNQEEVEAAFQSAAVEDAQDDAAEDTGTAEVSNEGGEGTVNKGKKKKKSKKTKIKAAIGLKSKAEDVSSQETDGGKPGDKKITTALLDKILENNAAIEGGTHDERRRNLEASLKQGDVSEMLTGMVCAFFRGC